MNPDTNRLEPLTISGLPNLEGAIAQLHAQLLRPDGTPVPKHWATFTVGETVVIKNYTFKIAYMNEATIVIEPVGPVLVGQSDDPR